jgi:hypothetical protein
MRPDGFAGLLPAPPAVAEPNALRSLLHGAAAIGLEGGAAVGDGLDTGIDP